MQESTWNTNMRARIGGNALPCLVASFCAGYCAAFHAQTFAACGGIDKQTVRTIQS